MFKKINKSLYIILLTLFSSCGILEQESLDNADDSKILTTVSGLRAARLGMYSLMCNENYYGGNYPLSIDAHSDNGVTGGYDFVALYELGIKNLTTSNLYVERIWVAIYATNNAANKILSNIDKVPNFSDSERKNIKGEALFVRALSHFDALKMYGDHSDNSSSFGIPIITRPQSTNDLPSRATVEASYVAIIKDLKDAKDLVEDVVTTSSGEEIIKDKSYITKDAIEALLARVYLFQKDFTNALIHAENIINSNKYSLFNDVSFNKLYTERQTAESIFELKFDIQNRSFYNAFTYKRVDAGRPDVNFMVSSDLNDFFKKYPNDIRSTTVDFVNNKTDISPDGRSQKYRGEITQDNPSYILRYAEMLLIAAEAKGYPDGLNYLNILHKKRGLSELTTSTIKTKEDFMSALSDEHRAEFNMEGQRYTTLVRMNKLKDILDGKIIKAFPLPLREVAASGGKLIQFDGY